VPRPTTCPSGRALLSAVLAALLLLPAAAMAALSVRTSVEELARGSDAVVRGTVIRRSGHRAGTRIYTEVTLRTAAVWRGTAPAEVTVRVPGGVVGNLGQRVDGAPELTQGEEAVLFLEADRAGGFRVHGLAQGKFRVEGASAAPDLRRTAFARSAVREGERAAEAMPLDELERRVRGTR
jgi:hypothetical protein